MICPKCKSSRFFQTEDPTRFVCIDCETKFRLIEEVKETKKQNHKEKIVR